MTAVLNRGIKKSPINAIVNFELAHCFVLLYNSLQCPVSFGSQKAKPKPHLIFFSKRRFFFSVTAC